ncbi:MAG: helix-turn-helix transcriptional regulator [Pseudomonadota bacterium]
MGLERILCVVANIRDDQTTWLNSILDVTGWTLTELARRAEVHQTTLTRMVADPTGKATLSARTVAAIAKATGFEPYARANPEARSQLAPLGDGEILSADGEILRGDLDAAVRAMVAARNHVFPWRIKTRALETAGYLPGDVAIVDTNALPKRGDAVCAQLYDWPNGRAETVLRLFEPPYLVAATFDGSLQRPHYVDEEKVVIKGVVTSMIRPRRAAA